MLILLVLGLIVVPVHCVGLVILAVERAFSGGHGLVEAREKLRLRLLIVAAALIYYLVIERLRVRWPWIAAIWGPSHLWHLKRGGRGHRGRRRALRVCGDLPRVRGGSGSDGAMGRNFRDAGDWDEGDGLVEAELLPELFVYRQSQRLFGRVLTDLDWRWLVNCLNGSSNQGSSRRSDYGRRWICLDGFFPRSVLIVGILLHVEQPQSFCFLDVGLLALIAQFLPPLSQGLGHLSIVDVRLELDDLLPLNVRENHEGVHRTLDVIGRVLLGLKQRTESKLAFFHSLSYCQQVSCELMMKCLAFPDW